MNVRKAEAKDLGRIAEILVFTKRSTYRPIFCNDEVSFNVITVLNVIEEVKEIGLEHTYLYDDGIVKGMTRYIEGGDGVEVCELYIDPFFQGQGVGKALIEFDEAQARELGAKEMYLWVLEKNPSAMEFYKNRGLEPTGERKEFATTGQYLVKFRKEL